MGFLRNIGYPFRRLRRDGIVSTVIILQLALAIGANTAIFSLVNALLLRSLPVQHPEELVLVTPYVKDNRAIVSYPVFRELRARQDVFTDVCAVQSLVRFERARLGVGGQEWTVNGSVVSASYFDTLGIRPVAGRFFDSGPPPAQSSPYATSPSAVISYGFWERQLGQRSDVIGSSLLLKNQAYTIIGVAPKGFSGETIGYTSDAWLLIDQFKSVDERENPNASFFQTIARLKPGVSRAQARTRTEALVQQLVRSREVGPTDESQRAVSAGLRLDLEPGGGGLSVVRREFALLLRIILAVVGLVLLTACLNVASLLVARNSRRAKDVAIQVAMGATWRLLLRQYLIESVMLGVVGGVGGVLVAVSSRNLLLSLVSMGSIPVSLELPIDVRVLAFTGVVSVLTGVVLGLFTASQAWAVDLNSTLKSESQGQTSTPSKLRLRRLLVVSQVAISLVLVISAGLLVKSLQNFRDLDPGFDVKNVLVLDVREGSEETTPERAEQVHKALQDALGRIPGVVSVSDSWLPLFTRNDMYAPLSFDGYTPRPGESMLVRFNCVSPKHLETLGVKLRGGRGIEERDNAASRHVAVVNESLAKKYFAGEQPIGKPLRIVLPNLPNLKETPIEIVGVVRDTKFNDLREPVKPMMYLSIYQYARAIRSVEIATASDPLALMQQVRTTLQPLESLVALDGMRTLAQQVERPLARERLIARVLAFFSILCLLLTCVGIYGLLSYIVSQRTREIGLRLALGAQQLGILWFVFREAVLLIAVGVAVGVPAALVGTKVLSSFLFGLRSTDPVITFGASLLVLACGGLAALIPGRRASRVQPAIALRCD